MPSQQHSRTTQKSAGKPPEDDDYNRRAQAHHKEYTAEWKKWWDALSPEGREEAIALGLSEPLQDSSRVSGHAPGEDRDAAESPLARTDFNFKSVEASTGPTPTNGNPWLNGDVALTMQRVVGMLISSDNAKVSVIALAFAMNLDALNGLGSIREAAKKMGLSAEAISKKKREWEKELDIPPNAFAKSAAAKRALSIAQQTKHWKNAKWSSLTKKPCKP